MQLGISTCFRDRRFSKAVRRVRSLFTSLQYEFANQELENPIHDAILVRLTDEPDSYLEEVPNQDSYFQMLAGIGPPNRILSMSDGQLAAILFTKVSAIVAACPFSTTDRNRMLQVLPEWAATHLPLNAQQRHSS